MHRPFPHCRIPQDPYSRTARILLRAALSVLLGLLLGSFLLRPFQALCVPADFGETACGYLRWLGVLFLFAASGRLTDCPPGRLDGDIPSSGGRKHLHRKNIRAAACGALAAAALTGLAFSAASLTGAVRCSFRTFSLLPLLFLLLCVLVQAGTEELIFRGTLLPALSAAAPRHPSAAIFGSALCFALFHAANPGAGGVLILHAFLAGIFYALLCRRFGSLCAPVAAHTVWNYSQSILLGLPDSGAVFPYSVFSASSPLQTPSFTYDPSSGLEGAWAPQIVLMAACFLLAFYGREEYNP